MGAAVGWLCLVEDLVPDDLRAVLDECVTPELDRVMVSVPWPGLPRPGRVDRDGAGLPRILRQLPDPAPFRCSVADGGPWAEAEGCADDPPF
ncbi:hypothetical protein [Streptomyces sp. SID3343]|uniref:hypothetical protein n=1 Tax=Streptomyces sp. SID3343 TaxID=2690260 RepID=UPI00136B08CB|nr:hypothetical protein [Streptomyces sp. SID3343]MYW06709.1 hypothetical protein [Streptomyces sp. SID3343]